MAYTSELRVKATLENVSSISQYIHALGQRFHLCEDMLFDIDLAVEEAAVNIIEHAYPPPWSGDILLQVDVTDDAVQIALTDWGLPIDPAKAKPAPVLVPVEKHIHEGKGLQLIDALMDTVVRTTTSTPGGPNTLALRRDIN